MRDAPEGWVRCYWPDEVRKLLSTGGVTALSLDHDLGDDAWGTGYDVLTWLEEKIVEAEAGDLVPPYILIHSANPVARQRMSQAVKWIYQPFQTRRPQEYALWATQHGI